jgi:hypothetical protein
MPVGVEDRGRLEVGADADDTVLVGGLRRREGPVGQTVSYFFA